MSGFTADDVTDQSGRTFFVTGANTGLGFEAARVLAARGGRVLLGCRSEDKATAAMAKIASAVPGADLRFVPLDQGDLASVETAAALVGEEDRLDVLVNNAGIMMPPLEYTTDGFESQFGVNHLGTFALTSHLLPMLSTTGAEHGGSRVVVTSSIAHKPGRIDFADLEAHERYDPQTRYQQSKLANLLFMYELDRRLRAAGSPTIAVACHPGIAATELARHLPKVVALAMPLVKLVLNSASQGAWPTLMAATSDDVDGGDYTGPSRFGETSGKAEKVESTDRARDPELAARLWDVSIELTGVDPRI
ncbi:MAG: oxidoreductase [Ilumatobacter sp.]|uniref:oxidoreductase n=1 Tax=Ilumatobacter sp. TaxID=1967498 RepID=UPI003298F9DB